MDLSFIDRLVYWLEHDDYVQYAPYMGGGWERWAQGQLCIHLRQFGKEARCEAATYGTTQRSDLVLPTNYGAFNQYLHWDIVELKCCKRWENSSEPLGTFFGITRMGVDVQKVRELNITDDYRGDAHHQWAIGMLTLQDVRDAEKNQYLTMAEALQRLQHNYQNVSFRSQNETIYSQAITYTGCESRAVFIAYYFQRWPVQ